MQLERKQRIKCAVLIICLWFTFFLHIFYGQNIYVVLNFENCERSEKNDSYRIIVYDKNPGNREERSGAIYEKSIREKFKIKFNQDLNMNIYLNPITEKAKLNSIVLYYNNVKISEILGTDIQNEFEYYNVEMEPRGENGVDLIKEEGEEPIMLWKNYGQELRTIYNIQGMKTFEALVVICLLCILIIWINKKEFFNRKYIRLNPNIIMLCILLVISIGVFYFYIKGDRYFAFTMADIGNDSINQNVPVLMEQARELENTGRIAPWSFQYGLGGDAQCDAFNYLFAIWGSKRLLYMLGIITVLKCILSGMFFFKYAELLEISETLMYIASASYAFCGHMIVRSAWFGYSKEVIIVAILMYGIEKWIKDKSWVWVPVAYALLFIFSGVFVTMLWIVIGIGYFFMRKSLRGEISFASSIKNVILWAGIIIIGALIASYKLMPAVTQILTSNRVHSMVADIGQNDTAMIKNFIPYSLDEITKSLLRLFSDCICGINQYNGVQNILSDAPLYSGLFAVLFVPQAMIVGTKKERKWSLVLYLICFYYICFPTIRCVINAFSDKYNTRISSFWINLVLIYISIHTLNHMLSECRGSKCILILTCIFECAFVIFGTYIVGTYEAQKECLKILFFLIILTVLLLLYLNKVLDKRSINELLIITFVFELVMISYPVVNDRYVLEDKYNNAYEDGTIEVLSEITDDNFYRINKTYQSVGLNDALYQDYYGTRSYLGGTTHSNELLDFNDAIGVRNMYSSTSYLLGYDGINSVNTMLGVKYNLSRDEQLPYGYKNISSNDELYLSENEYSLPLGYGYNTIISEKDFYSMNVFDRREMLLNSVIVSDDDGLLKQEDIKYGKKSTEYEYIVSKESNVLKFNKENSNATLKKDVLLSVPDKGKAVFDVSGVYNENLIVYAYVNASVRANTYVTLVYADGKEYSKVYYLQEGENYIRADLLGGDLEQIILKTEREIDIKIEKFSTTCMSDRVYSQYLQNTQDRLTDTLKISKMQGDYIKGTINNTSSELLFLSIPYNENWHIYVDGKEEKVKKLNIAFMGCYLPKGGHDIEVRFEKNNPYIICSVSVWVGYIVIICLINFGGYIRKFQRKDKHKV